MNRTKKNIRGNIIVYCLLLSTFSEAQDFHYTHFYYSPYTINPALTGSFKRRYSCDQ